MKILAISDIHNNLKMIKELAKLARKRKVELVIFAGDLSFFLDFKDSITPFLKEKIDVLIVPGNHDDVYLLEEYIKKLEKKYKKKIHLLEGNFVEIKNYYFIGFSANNIGPSLNYYSERESRKILNKIKEEIEKKEAKELNKLRERVITISHIHPSHLIEAITYFPGSKAWLNFIEENQPLIHFHGHIHETEGLKYMIKNTIVFNLGPSTPVLIDLEELKKELISKKEFNKK